jgi:hypothetical protein
METTKPSAEQATMLHVQGSTELISHPSITCNSSFSLLFTAIKAVTASSKNTKIIHFNENRKKVKEKQNLGFVS